MFSNKNYEFIDNFPSDFISIKNKVFNDWEIPPWKLEINVDKLLGEGEFGKVYMAKWNSTEVVAKVINHDISDEKKSLFIKEINLHTILVHPNIVQFLGYVLDPLVIVMEYIPNGELLDYINKSFGVSVSKKIEICKNILKAIEYLHGRSPNAVLHRDLKPHNIMMTPSGFPKLSDFGISRIVEKLIKKESPRGSPQDTQIRKASFNEIDSIPLGNIVSEGIDLTKFCGSKRYMSPEMYNNETYDFTTDIWSLGIIFSELFENKRYNPNRDFIYKKTPKEIKNIIVDNMLQKYPKNRLNATEVIKLFNEVEEYRKKKYWIINALY